MVQSFQKMNRLEGDLPPIVVPVVPEKPIRPKFIPIESLSLEKNPSNSSLVNIFRP